MVLELNQAALKFTGLQLAEVVNCPIWEIYCWQISQATQDQLKQAIARAAQGEFISYEVEVQGIDNQILTIDFSIRPIRNDAGEVVMLISEGRDITEAKLNEAKRKQAEAILKFQAQILEEIHDAVITMEQVSSLINENNQNVEHAKELSQTNKEITDNANAIVDEAIDGLQRISDSSENISNITNVIDEIAFQTNLLSLNASVEAARAGEAGKGFAVVASEVRSLADRSSKASKEIKALISKSKEEVVLGAASVNNTGKALKNIAEVTNDSSESIQKIAVSSLEQSSGLMTINNLVKEIDQLNAINRSLIENNKKISYLFKEQIKNQTEKLQNLAAEFSS
jgi:methyl-accepting chemotaxis protein